MKTKKKFVFVAGIRPDLIKSVILLRILKQTKDIQTIFIWSGQHYSDNLKDIFFRELHIPKPDIELGCFGETDAEISSQLIAKLYPVLTKINPDAVAFFGDTNTTTGCIAAAQLNIPIIHIEGCWHSYDWRMPEEKYRTMIDHLSDVIYTYSDEYKVRGIAEGLNPRNIIVVGNPVVDILNEYYFSHKSFFEKKATASFFKKRGIENGKYYLLTCHRRENVQVEKSFRNIMKLIKFARLPVYFPASYRTQKVMKKMKLKIPKNLLVVDPTGYKEILTLMTHAKAVITDSGTLNEEACILNIPCINMRKSTERPEVYDSGGCIKFDPDIPTKYPFAGIFKKLEKITGKKWQHTFGDGKSSKKIAKDIITRLKNNNVRGHLPQDNHLPIQRSFIEDGINI